MNNYFYFTFGSEGQLFRRGYVKIRADTLPAANKKFVEHYGDKAWKDKDSRILSYAFPYNHAEFDQMEQFRTGDWSICHEFIE